jgi:RHS repeat-associated protein
VALDFVDTDGSEGAATLALSARYLWGPAVDQLLAQEDVAGTVVKWMLPDQLGSTRDIVGNSGEVVSHFSYDSFGNVTLGNLSDTRYLYTCQEYDLRTGFYYYDARWYDPRTATFVSLDPMGLRPDSNPYRYVGNSPTNYIDPTGFCEEEEQQYEERDQRQDLVYERARTEATDRKERLRNRRSNDDGWSPYIQYMSKLWQNQMLTAIRNIIPNFGQPTTLADVMRTLQDRGILKRINWRDLGIFDNLQDALNRVMNGQQNRRGSDLGNGNSGNSTRTSDTTRSGLFSGGYHLTSGVTTGESSGGGGSASDVLLRADKALADLAKTKNWTPEQLAAKNKWLDQLLATARGTRIPDVLDNCWKWAGALISRTPASGDPDLKAELCAWYYPNVWNPINGYLTHATVKITIGNQAFYVDNGWWGDPTDIIYGPETISSYVLPFDIKSPPDAPLWWQMMQLGMSCDTIGFY